MASTTKDTTTFDGRMLLKRPRLFMPSTSKLVVDGMSHGRQWTTLRPSAFTCPPRSASFRNLLLVCLLTNLCIGANLLCSMARNLHGCYEPAKDQWSLLWSAFEIVKDNRGRGVSVEGLPSSLYIRYDDVLNVLENGLLIRLLFGWTVDFPIRCEFIAGLTVASLAVIDDLDGKEISC